MALSAFSAYFQVRHAITPLRRAAHNMHKALQAGREAVPDDRELISCRNMADTIERAAELVYEDAEHGLQYAIARQAAEISLRASEQRALNWGMRRRPSQGADVPKAT